MGAVIGNVQYGDNVIIIAKTNSYGVVASIAHAHANSCCPGQDWGATGGAKGDGAAVEAGDEAVKEELEAFNVFGELHGGGSA